MRIFASLALLAFGDLSYLDRALELLSKNPEFIYEAPVRPFIGTLVYILPWPLPVNPNDFGDMLVWFRQNRSRLSWNEQRGQFVLLSG
jgi:hypothetical protein